MIELTNVTNNVVEVKATGKVSEADIMDYASKLEKIIAERAPVRILVDANYLDGWEDKKAMEAHARMIQKNHKQVERMGLISGHMWQQWLAAFVGMFTYPEIRTSDQGQSEEVRAWIYEGIEEKKKGS